MHASSIRVAWSSTFAIRSCALTLVLSHRVCPTDACLTVDGGVIVATCDPLPCYLDGLVGFEGEIDRCDVEPCPLDTTLDLVLDECVPDPCWDAALCGPCPFDAAVDALSVDCVPGPCWESRFDGECEPCVGTTPLTADCVPNPCLEYVDGEPINTCGPNPCFDDLLNPGCEPTPCPAWFGDDAPVEDDCPGPCFEALWCPPVCGVPVPQPVLPVPCPAPCSGIPQSLYIDSHPGVPCELPEEPPATDVDPGADEDDADDDDGDADDAGPVVAGGDDVDAGEPDPGASMTQVDTASPVYTYQLRQPLPETPAYEGRFITDDLELRLLTTLLEFMATTRMAVMGALTL